MAVSSTANCRSSTFLYINKHHKLTTTHSKTSSTPQSPKLFFWKINWKRKKGGNDGGRKRENRHVGGRKCHYFYKKLNFVEPYVHPSLPIMAKFGKRLNL